MNSSTVHDRFLTGAALGENSAETISLSGSSLLKISSKTADASSVGHGGDRSIASSILDFLTFLVSLFVYADVFVVFNSIEAVLVINPFPFVDPVLKGFRSTIIGFIFGLSRVHTGLGFLAALAVFVACLCVVHFCLRLTIISFVYSIGFLKRLFGLTGEPDGDNLRAFACWHFHGAPWLTYGKVRRTEAGTLAFIYKRLFLEWERTVALPAGMAVAIGTFNPYLVGRAGQDEEHPLMRFSPVYRGHETILCKSLRVDKLDDVSLPTSFKRVVRLVWDTIRGRRGLAHPTTG